MGDVTFAILSFEGPDRYSHAGGLGSRVTGLAEALAGLGFETHLFFIGDPDLPGQEDRGRLHLHRWCQWISRHHPAGVYDGEEGKLRDWSRSLPEWILSELVGPVVRSGGWVVVLAEEWHTAAALQALHAGLVRMGCRDRVQLVWNANNTFGFHRVPFAELRRVAVMTTVSRYMKHVMWDYGVDPWVIANGIPERWLEPVPRVDCARLARLFAGRTTLAKVARWDPDKRWAMCVDAVALMKGQGLRPLLIARGGVEEHGREILARARGLGLRIASARWSGAGLTALEEAMAPAVRADMVVLQDYVSEEQRRVLFRTADAVVANSGIEPFGLVGLETMAVGGVALVGCTGEDYATPGHDSIALQTSDPREILQCAFRLRSGDTAFRLRRAARRSAALYTWPAVITRTLPRFLEVQGIPRMQVPAGGIHPGTAGETSEPREAPARVVAAPR